MREIIIHLSVAILLIGKSFAQSPGDYRTRQSGAWATITNWQTFDGANWVNATLAPNSSNGMITILAAHIITTTGTITADQIVINSGAMLNITNGTFTVNDTLGTDLDCSGTLMLSNGTLTGAGTVTCNSNSSFNWLAGTNGGTGTMNISAGAALSTSTGTVFLSDTKTLNNYGTWTWTNGTFCFSNGTPVINNYGIFNINTDDDLTRSLVNTGVFNNMPTGAINKSGSPNDETSFSFISSFTNAGTINVNSGKLKLNINSVNTGNINIGFGANMNFAAGVALFNTGTVVAGSGSINFEGGNDTLYTGSFPVNNINISGGTVSINTAITLNNGSSINLTGGLLTGTATIILNSGAIFNWSGGTNGGSGIININSGAAININNNNVYLADTKTLNNYGIFTWTNGIFYFAAGSPVVNNYGTFNISTDDDLLRSIATAGSFNNMPAGTINKTGAPSDETSFNNIVSFNNAGTINVSSGTLKLNINSVHTGTINVAFGANMNFSLGNAIFNTGTVLSGAGSLNFEGGNDTLYAATVAVANFNISNGVVSIVPPVTMNSGATMTLSAGTLTGASVITFNAGSIFNWAGGINGGSGVMNINAGSSLIMNNTNVYLADTKTLNNYGTWNWTNGAFYFNNGAPTVNNYGTFNINTDGDVTRNLVSTGSFNNKPSGVINKIGSPSNQTSFSGFGSFNSAGAININSGNLSLDLAGSHTGTYKIAYGSQLRGTSAMLFTGTAFINDGGVTLASLSFTGTAAQSIIGEGSVNTLTVNNTNGLTLGGSQTINTALTLTSGKITLGDNNLILATTAALTGGNATNYIVTNGLGIFQRRVLNNNTAILFPIGFPAAYMPVTIQLTAASTTDNFAVRLWPAIHGGYDTTNGNAVGGGINANTVNSSWFINEGVAGGSNATISFTWNAGNESTGFNRTLSRFGQYRNNTWNVDPATVAATGANPYTITRSALNSFSIFGITNQFATSMGNYDAFCSPAAINIPYTATGTFNAGNIFTAQLSDSTGSYASPVVIGSVASIVSGSISASIPANTLKGTGYKIRIASSSPVLTGPDNPSRIQIRPCAAQPPILTKNIPMVNVSNISSAEAVVNWNSIALATGYEVQFKQAVSSEWNAVIVLKEQLPMKLLQPGTRYEVKVRATVGRELSDFSEIRSFTTLSGESIISMSDGKLAIYPNPNNGRFTLMLHFKEIKTGLAELRIVNTAGQVMSIERISISEYQLKKTISFHPSISSGMYFISVMAGNKKYYGSIFYQQ